MIAPARRRDRAAAGTSDLPVLEEASLTLDLMGHAPTRIVDVGVAGLHRLLPHVATLQAANVIVVAAGMEGALPSVIGGLTDAPVIAVPTSVGYGAKATAPPRCWPCSTVAPRASVWSTSTTASAPVTWPLHQRPHRAAVRHDIVPIMNATNMPINQTQSPNLPVSQSLFS
ncbi:MAG: AIR carboxylase family protein [Caldilineaceae bacterium]